MRDSRVTRHRRKKKYLYLKVFLLSVLFVAAFAGGRFIYGLVNPDAPSVALETNENGELLPVERLNVLLLGIDARPGEKDSRTDSMILVSIDRATKKIAMVSIPRDTIVEIPGHGREKINSANIYGGVDLARETVENLMGVKIPYYVKTNFDGFKDIVDTLGGVTIDVEKRMVYRAEGIDLYPGVQRLDGYNALGYVRFRYDTLGDISRTQRQQNFLTALAREMLQAGTIIKLPKLAPEIMSAVDTNLNIKDMYFLAKVAANLDSQNIMTATLPGIFYNDHGSYWKADEIKAKLVLDNLFAGTKVATVEGSYTEPGSKPARKLIPKETKPAPADSTAGTSPETETQSPETNLPDGQQPNGQQLPEDQNGTSPTQPGSGSDAGSTSEGSQPVPPVEQPTNPPINPPTGSQSGSTGTGTTPQQPAPKPPNTTGGGTPGTSGAAPDIGGAATGTGGSVTGANMVVKSANADTAKVIIQ